MSVDNLALVLGRRRRGGADAAANARREGEGAGKEHPGTLTSANNLVLLLRDQGTYEETERMHRRVLEGWEKALAKEHLDTLTSVNNLAIALRDQGKYKEAGRMHRRALEERERRR
jgi:tetratricopeptide (TPR) repeat protein